MPKTLDSHFSIMSTNRALQPPLPAALRPYEDVMKLLAAFSGPNCEVVLHDLSDPVHSVVRVENGEVTGRAVGQGLRHLVPNLLRMPEPMTADLVPRARISCRFIGSEAAGV